MKTLANATAEFIAYLEKLQFVKGRHYSESCQIHDMHNSDGFPILRVALHMSEGKPEYASICSFTGTRAQLLEWEIDTIPAELPLGSILGLIKGAFQIA